MGDHLIGLGPTTELNLRVSIATLSRVVLPRPGDGVPMLALEHKATLKSEPRVSVKAQPLGGAIRILNLNRIQGITGNFNFDSEKSQTEQDFRIYVSPSSWEGLRDFCIEELGQSKSSVLDFDPKRELVEEFEDALEIHLRSGQYTLKQDGIVLENEPAPTENVRAGGYPTVRIYRVDEVQIQDTELYNLMMSKSESHPPRVLKELVQEEAREGGRGRANAMLVSTVERVRTAILAMPVKKRGEPLQFEGTYLDGNVSALFNDIPVPKYLHLR